MRDWGGFNPDLPRDRPYLFGLYAGMSTTALASYFQLDSTWREKSCYDATTCAMYDAILWPGVHRANLHLRFADGDTSTVASIRAAVPRTSTAAAVELFFLWSDMFERKADRTMTLGHHQRFVFGDPCLLMEDFDTPNTNVHLEIFCAKGMTPAVHVRLARQHRPEWLARAEGDWVPASQRGVQTRGGLTSDADRRW